jgi:hypothetical protein
MFQHKYLLPRTPEAYDELVDKVCKKFKLIDKHHAAAVISVAIRHLPPEQGTTTLEYLGHYVIKNIANYVANHKGEILKHEGQVNQLVDNLKNNPNDQQSRDSLYTAASDGSPYAIKALEKLGFEPAAVPAKPVEPTDNVVPIVAAGATSDGPKTSA